MQRFRAAFGLPILGLVVLLSSCARTSVDSSPDLSSPRPAVPFEALAQQKKVIDGGSGGGSVGDAFDANGGMVRQMRGADEIDYTYDTHLQVTEQKNLLNGGSMGTVAQQNVYDGDGNQIAFYSATATYTYVTAGVRTVSRNDGAPVALVSYEDSETDESGKLQQMVKDHLGSVVAIIDSQDGFRMVKDQLPFGATWYEREVASYSNPTDKGFNGNRDEGFKNYGVERLNYNARHYAPELGRFMQADSVTPEGGATVINWNRYVYVNNNPMNGIDPDGHMPLFPIGAILTGLKMQQVENDLQHSDGIERVVRHEAADIAGGGLLVMSGGTGSLPLVAQFLGGVWAAKALHDGRDPITHDELGTAGKVLNGVGVLAASIPFIGPESAGLLRQLTEVIGEGAAQQLLRQRLKVFAGAGERSPVIKELSRLSQKDIQKMDEILADVLLQRPVSPNKWRVIGGSFSSRHFELRVPSGGGGTARAYFYRDDNGAFNLLFVELKKEARMETGVQRLLQQRTQAIIEKGQ